MDRGTAVADALLDGAKGLRNADEKFAGVPRRGQGRGSAPVTPQAPRELYARYRGILEALGCRLLVNPKPASRSLVFKRETGAKMLFELEAGDPTYASVVALMPIPPDMSYDAALKWANSVNAQFKLLKASITDPPSPTIMLRVELIVVAPESAAAQLGIAIEAIETLYGLGEFVGFVRPDPAGATAPAPPRSTVAATEIGVSSVYRLKITLRGVKPPVWRRIDVRADTTLPQLHRAFQAALGWEDAHLHAFVVDRTRYGTGEAASTSERGVRLDQVVGAPKRGFTYEYDFGDGWVHDVVVESIGRAVPEASYPRYLAGRGACPPEDVGGPAGYDAFLAALADPHHPDHAELVAWSGGAFDPKRVDVARIEAAFAALAAAKRGLRPAKPHA